MLYIWYRMLKCCQNIHFIIFDIEKNHLRVMIFKKISNRNLFNIRDTFSTSPKKGLNIGHMILTYFYSMHFMIHA